MEANEEPRYERDSCLTLRCPRWFADPDFAAYLRRREVAVWRPEGVDVPLDVFVWYGGEGEGSDAGAMPNAVWDEIAALADGIGYVGLVRIVNEAA